MCSISLALRIHTLTRKDAAESVAIRQTTERIKDDEAVREDINENILVFIPSLTACNVFSCFSSFLLISYIFCSFAWKKYLSEKVWVSIIDYFMGTLVNKKNDNL